MNHLRTSLLLALLTALFMVIGNLLGDIEGMLIALGFAALFNLHAYCCGDVAALRANQAREAQCLREAQVIDAVGDLAQHAGIPAPHVYFSDCPQPNAFAVGRNPQTASLLISTGLLDKLNRNEILGVLAHEIAHIRARDTLTTTITATLAGAIASFGILGLLIGAATAKRAGLFAVILSVFTILAAGLLQMAVSRSREYAADAAGARICGHPEWIASALRKLDRASLIRNRPAEMYPAIAPLFIVNPLGNHWLARLFNTHPPTARRIARLQAMNAKRG